MPRKTGAAPGRLEPSWNDQPALVLMGWPPSQARVFGETTILAATDIQQAHTVHLVDNDKNKVTL